MKILTAPLMLIFNSIIFGPFYAAAGYRAPFSWVKEGS